MNKYAETATAPGHSDEETRGRCRKGLAKLCADQVCATAQPETCKIQAGRSQEVCQAESEQDDICQKCGTSACGKCRSLYVQLCTKPEIFTSAQECLNKYAETATAPGHTDEDTRGRCRKGLAKLCASQVCTTGQIEEPPTCKVNAGRAADKCHAEASADEKCGSGASAAARACRALYVHLCSKPEIFSRVEECLEKYAYTAFAPDNEDQDDEARALATKGLRSICLEQVCQWAEEKPVICPANEQLPTIKVVEVRLEGQCWDCQMVANLEAELDLLKKLADRLKALAGYKGVKVETDDCWVPPTTTTVVVSTDGTATRTSGNDASTSSGQGTAATGQTEQGTTTTTDRNGESTTTGGTTNNGTTAPHHEEEEEESEASSVVLTRSSSANTATSAASSASGGRARESISSESSSAAGTSALATALGIVAASVVAGVAAVGVGFAVSGAGASAAAPASAANMGSAATNPLYQATANSGDNIP